MNRVKVITMPAFSFEKIAPPAQGDQTVDRLLKQPVDQSRDSAAVDDSSEPKRRGRVINWLDRLVEKRIEKVERDIERVNKIAGPLEH